MQLDLIEPSEFANIIIEALKTRLIVRVSVLPDKARRSYRCEAILLVADEKGKMQIIGFSADENLTVESGAWNLSTNREGLINYVEAWKNNLPLFYSDDYHVAVEKRNEGFVKLPTTHVVVHGHLLRTRDQLWSLIKREETSLHPILGVAYNRLGAILKVDRQRLLEFYDQATQLAGPMR